MAGTAADLKLDVPSSNHTVRVRMINTKCDMHLYAKMFIKPVVPGHETMNMSDMAFLIENDHLGKKAMWDLGTRKDYWNLSPAIRDRLGMIAVGLKVSNDVSGILTEKDIPLESINDIIWSHAHWDHVGDPTLFPPTTNLVYGAEISSLKPGYPADPTSALLSAYFEGRKNIEISFPSDTLNIGGFQAIDFYGDGSFYLLSTPGHAHGHMCALARTTPDTFIFLGGDVCHFTGDLRPNKAHPFPDPLPDGVLDKNPTFPTPCPASFFLDDHPQFRDQESTTSSAAQDRVVTPYYALSTASPNVYETPSPEVARATVATLTTHFDSASNVFVALAHDPALPDHLPSLNDHPDADLNDWFARGWKAKCYWGWLNEVARRGRPGRAPIVEGWWRDGKVFATAQEAVAAKSML